MKRLNTLLPRLLCCLLLVAGGVVSAQDYSSLLEQALEQRNAGNFTAAESLLRQALPLAEDQREVRELLALVIAFQERHDEAGTLLEASLALYPGDRGLRLAQARVTSYQGDYQRASTLLEKLRTEYPGDSELDNLAGRLALYRSRPGEAQRIFTDVLSREPDNLEALIGQYDAARALNDEALARASLLAAERVSPGHMDVESRKAPAESPLKRQHELSVGYSRGRFSVSAIPDWNDRFIEYRHLRSNGNQEFLRLSHNHHFALHDTQFEAGLLRRQNQSWPLELAVGFTENAEFMAEHFLRAATRMPLGESSQQTGTLVLAPLYQYSSYLNGNTHRIQLGFEYYPPFGNLWLTPAVGMVRDQDGTDSFSWVLGLHWQASAGNRLGASYSDIPETENLLTTETRTYSLYWRRTLSDSLSVTFNLDRLERSGSYQRNQFSLVLQQRF